MANAGTGERPHRVRRLRERGWKMPANTVYVGRPTKWGNPFTLHEGTREEVVEKYRREIEGRLWTEPNIKTIRAELRGKNLACWCHLSEPCHADVLLEIANAGTIQVRCEGITPR